MPDTPPQLIDDADMPLAAPAPRTAAARVPSGASAAAQTAPIASVPVAMPAELPVLTEVVSLPTGVEPHVIQVEPEPALAATPTSEAFASTEPAVKPAVPELSPAECAARLAELFPALFAAVPNMAPKPIKLRIQADIQARAPGLFSRKSLSPFLHRHTTSTAYLRALVGSAHRYDLDGAPAGEVNDEHRQAAQLELERRRAIVQARRVAERQAGRGAPAGAGAQAAAAGASAAAAGDPGPPGSPQFRRDGGSPQMPRGPRPPREADDRRRARPPRAGRPPQAGLSPRNAATPPVHRPRPDHPPRHAPQTPVHASTRPEPAHAAAALPDDPARRERALLLRAYESSTLSRANFCALKRIDPAALDALLEKARAEARPAATPKRPAR